MDEEKDLEERRNNNWDFGDGWAGIIALIAVAAIFGGWGKDKPTIEDKKENENGKDC